MVTVDNDTSTNDMVIVLANGAAENKKITEKNSDYEKFYSALKEMCTELAKRIAADGEGATKFLTVNVHGAENFADAKKVAMSVANSPLVKTAAFGEDLNFGRIICAVGYSGVKISPEKVVIKYGNIPVYAHSVAVNYDAEAMKKIISAHDIIYDIELGIGEASATVWTCDFSFQYIKINADYTT